MLFAKFIFLVLAIMFGYICVARLFVKQTVHSVQIILMSVGIAGFVILQWVA